MKGYVLVNLRDMIEQLGEDKTKNILSNFSCPLNKDVDGFLKNKSSVLNPNASCKASVKSVLV